MKNPLPHPAPLPPSIKVTARARTDADDLAAADQARRDRLLSLAGPAVPPPATSITLSSNGRKSWKSPPGGSA